MRSDLGQFQGATNFKPNVRIHLKSDPVSVGDTESESVLGCSGGSVSLKLPPDGSNQLQPDCPICFQWKNKVKL